MRHGDMRMMRPGAAAFAGGACLSAALGGACTALTSIPPPLLAATGIALILCSRASVACPLYLLAGLAAGLLLPSTPPPIAGDVRTQSAGSALFGDLFETLDRLDEDPSRVIGHRVSVSGEWAPASPDRLPTVSRHVMNCCAADAIAVGFDVELARTHDIARGTWVCIAGVVRERIRDGERRYVLEQSTVGGLEDRAVHSC
jgi:hypothetical protein